MCYAAVVLSKSLVVGLGSTEQQALDAALERNVDKVLVSVVPCSKDAARFVTMCGGKKTKELIVTERGVCLFNEIE